MKSSVSAKEIVKAVLILVGIAIGCFVLYLLRSLLLYFAIAAVLALIGRRIVFFFHVILKFGNTLASVCTLLLLTLIFVATFALFFPLLADQGKNLAMLDFENLQNSIKKLGHKVGELFGASPGVVEDILEASQMEEDGTNSIDRSYYSGMITSLISFIGNFGIGFFSTLFITFFMLKDSKLIQRALLKLIPLTHHSKVLHSFSMTKDLLSRYFVGIVFQIIILFGIYAITLLTVGIENAIVIAFLCALFNIIPYIGPLIGAILMIVLTLMHFSDMDFVTVAIPNAGYVLIGITIGQLIDNFFSQPFIFSNSVKSHPLEIFTIILVAGILFGPLGMMIAVPFYTVVKIFLKEFWPENRLVRFMTKDL